MTTWPFSSSVVMSISLLWSPGFAMALRTPRVSRSCRLTAVWRHRRKVGGQIVRLSWLVLPFVTRRQEAGYRGTTESHSSRIPWLQGTFQEAQRRRSVNQSRPFPHFPNNWSVRDLRRRPETRAERAKDVAIKTRAHESTRRPDSRTSLALACMRFSTGASAPADRSASHQRSIM